MLTTNPDRHARITQDIQTTDAIGRSAAGTHSRLLSHRLPALAAARAQSKHLPETASQTAMARAEGDTPQDTRHVVLHTLRSLGNQLSGHVASLGARLEKPRRLDKVDCLDRR